MKLNTYLQETLDKVVNKFKKMEAFQTLNDDDSAFEILHTITDDEIKVLESIGKTFVTMADDIRYFKNEKKENV
jgi:K+/H+ antiporter YhaU regulatory subunit KhtT